MTIYGADGNGLLEVDVDDTSYRYREIMGDDSVTLKFSSAVHVEIPVGAWCEFGGETYTLARPEALTMHHSRDFEYTVVMEGPQWRAGIWKFRNTADGRLSFSLTAAPKEHLDMLIDNLNAREKEIAGGGDGWEPVWSAGECLEHDEVCVCYDHAYCIEALAQMADAFGTEYEIDGRTVSLRKVEHDRDNPISLSYGKGRGFRPDVGRSNSSDSPPAEILYPQGGTDNIDASKYPQELHRGVDPDDPDNPDNIDPKTGEPYGGDGTGNGQNTHSTVLLLPPGREIGYDGESFCYRDKDTGEWDYGSSNANSVRKYIVDEQGYYVRRSDRDLDSRAEDSLDCSEIYPKRVGDVTGVIEVSGDDNFYDFVDDTIPDGLDYAECQIDGETMTVIFQSGMLAGREFDISKYYPDEKRFEVVPQEIDGETMPQGEDEPFHIAVGDKYAIFNCMLPASYICDDSDHSGAEWDMLRECVRHLYDNEEERYTITGKMDGIWSRDRWEEIGPRVRPGGFVEFVDERFQRESLLIRITGVKDYINSPCSPELELSNETVRTGNVLAFHTELSGNAILAAEDARRVDSRAQRRIRDINVSVGSLEEAVDGLLVSVGDIEDEIGGDDGLDSRVGQIEDEIGGDGGLEDRVRTVESSVKTMSAAIGEIVDALNGTDGTAGIISVIGDLQKAVTDLNNAMSQLQPGFVGGEVGGEIGTVDPYDPDTGITSADGKG